MIKAAITGGVGMGKSTVGALITKKGYPLIDTDEIARDVVQKGSAALQLIVDAFGGGVLSPDGSLNRKELGKKVFGQPEELQRLNAITHPEIRSRWITWLEKQESNHEKIAFVTIPLLFEIQMEKAFDKILCVGCSQKTQKLRLENRGWSQTHSSDRIMSQMPIQEKIKKSDFLIWTDTSLSIVGWQTDVILKCCC